MRPFAVSSKSPLAGTGKTRWRGWSLIELLCVITMLGMLSVLSVKLLVLLMQQESQGERNAALELTWQRLEDRFREDVHAAQRVQAQVADDGLPMLTLAGETTVRYRNHGRGCLRLADGSSTPAARDYFPLGEGTCDFEVDGRTVRLLHSGSGAVKVPRAVSGTERPIETTRIDAVLGETAPLIEGREGQP